jgi:hypothetical protein
VIQLPKKSWGVKNIATILLLACFSASAQTRGDLERQIRDLREKIEEREFSEDLERSRNEENRIAAEEARLLALPLDPDLQRLAQRQFAQVYGNRSIDQRDKATAVKSLRLQLARAQEARNLAR